MEKVKSLVGDQEDLLSSLPCPACLGILQVYLEEPFLNRVSPHPLNPHPLSLHSLPDFALLSPLCMCIRVLSLLTDRGSCEIQ